METPGLAPYRYCWPQVDLGTTAGWVEEEHGSAYVRRMPETTDELARDSRWPAFFPSPMCFVTTRGTDGRPGLEKVVGASIVNRFPYIIALSFCRKRLSGRHHVRGIFTEILEETGVVAVQFLPPGDPTDRAMDAIASVPEEQTEARIQRSDLEVRDALTNGSPVFREAYMVYEARLVAPGKDFSGRPIYERPWVDIGSHRVYFLEINAIQLRQDIAEGQSQIRWRSLPAWQPVNPLQGTVSVNGRKADDGLYKKGYTPHYAFPSAGTVAFEADVVRDGMAVKHLPPLPSDQVEVDTRPGALALLFPVLGRHDNGLGGR